MLIASIPVLFAIAGILVWALASNGVLKEAGKITFAAAMFALMFALAPATAHLLMK